MHQASTAKYILHQYIAATGGQPALNTVGGEDQRVGVSSRGPDHQRVKNTEEAGGFVLWQKDPDLWILKLVVSGCKVICGSNGKLSWRHSSNQQTPISR
ncbi:unnamed protein product [Linum trigynum]|uniref:Uncharacterized protein n=1 Tax=Linum trigynum TaxID=586398 RepID=A0AAV2DSG3_9ROSI